MIKIEITNLAEFSKKMDALPGKVLAESARTLREEAEEVMEKSKQLVPRDLSTLADSGHVPPTERERNAVSVSMVYGGEAKEYAIAVHEHPSIHSPESWSGKTIKWNVPGTGPKFLERPYVEALPKIPARLIEAFKRAFR